MATLQSPRFITHFPSFKTIPTASYRRTLTPSLLHLHIRRQSAPMAPSSDAAEGSAAGSSETTSDVLVQYVVLRRDLIDTWPLGSVVTQGCHASVAAIWLHKDDPHTIDYCSPTNLDSMHKATTVSLIAFADMLFDFASFQLILFILYLSIIFKLRMHGIYFPIVEH